MWVEEECCPMLRDFADIYNHVLALEKNCQGKNWKSCEITKFVRNRQSSGISDEAHQVQANNNGIAEERVCVFKYMSSIFNILSVPAIFHTDKL